MTGRADSRLSSQTADPSPSVSGHVDAGPGDDSLAQVRTRSSWRLPVARSAAVLVILLLLTGAWSLLSSQYALPVAVLSVEMALAPEAGEMQLDGAALADGLDWQPLDQRELADWTGPYWLRWQLAPLRSQANTAQGLRLGLRAASRMYWNGELLADNGVVGRTREQERSGRVDFVVALPPAAQDGQVDELLVFASSQRQWLRLRSADAWVEVGPLDALHQGRIWPWLVVAIAVGVLAAAWSYGLVGLRGQQRSTGARLLLWLGAVGLALPMVEAWRPLLGYPYEWHGVRLFALLLLHLAAAILLPAYLARRFAVPLPSVAYWLYAAVLLAVLLLLPGFDGRGASLMLISLLTAGAVLLCARGEPDERIPALTVLFAGVLGLLFDPRSFLDGHYVLLLTVLMGFLLLRHAQRQSNVDRDNSRLRAERSQLSLQLLRRAMEPHWLMNTLTSLQELIEQAPDRASRLVELLAEHFERLREGSQQERVSLAEELALCRSYLDTVSLVLDRPIELAVDADVDTSRVHVPPGVLHAQVENALTHAGAAASATRPFRVSVRRNGGTCVVELRAALGSAGRRGRGTGTRYIEASLAAASPAGWRYEQGADGADWCGRIELTCES